MKRSTKKPGFLAGTHYWFGQFGKFDTLQVQTERKQIISKPSDIPFDTRLQQKALEMQARRRHTSAGSARGSFLKYVPRVIAERLYEFDWFPRKEG
jgi:hypothetical protein